MGREADLHDLYNRLFNNKQVVLVNGLGGIGKTTLAQVYVAKYWNKYHYVTWISQISENVIEDFVNAKGLLQSLNIQKSDKELNNAYYCESSHPKLFMVAT